MSKSTSKLSLMFVFDSVSYYRNASMTYFAKKGAQDARITRISRASYETALGAAKFEAECRAEIEAESTQAQAESVDLTPATTESDPTPAPVTATVDATPAPIEAAPVSDPIVDAVTRPDWAAQATFERLTWDDLKAVPATVARGLGIATMATLKVAAMGIGAMVGLGLMGLKRSVAR